jgi:hypothetical protein
MFKGYFFPQNKTIVYGVHIGRETWPVNIPVHPDQISLLVGVNNSQEVTFDIVYENEVKYAKIIS